MATKLTGLPVVGDVVYKHYTPTKPGRITAIYMDDPDVDWYQNHWQRRYQVLLANGTYETWNGREIAGSISGLITDHEKKVATHRALLERMLAVEPKE